MRFVAPVVAAAFVLIFLYLLVGFFVDGYFGGNIMPFTPDDWEAPKTWAKWRDVVIVIFGALMVLWALLAVAVMAAILALVLTVRQILRKNVAPAIDSLKDSLDNVRGTTEFAGETVVAPIIRVYSIIRGVRSGISAVSNLPGFIKRRKG